MKHRLPKSYTVWIARTGKKPIVLSIRPLALMLAIGLPAMIISAVLFSFIYQNVQLTRRNSQLTEEAADILQQLEALESNITSLQERAKIANEQEDEESFDAEEGDAADDFESDWNEAEDSQDDDSQLEFQEWNEDSDASEEYQSDDDQSFDPRGGENSIVGAEALLAAARAKLPGLLRQVRGEVEPALQKIIVRTEAKPQGLPLKASDTEMTSTFGLRPNPFGWGYEFHQGIDFAAAYGSPIHSTAPGIVTKAEWEPGFGNHVVVDHGYGYETLYAHLSEIAVNIDDRVERDQIIGYLGNTGRSSGPHLHYEVYRHNTVTDPKDYLD